MDIGKAETTYKSMKLKKLLQEARRQSALCDVYEDLYVRADRMQWIVRVIFLTPPGVRSIKAIYRFKTKEEAETYREFRYYERIEANIAYLRNKYNRPSKSKTKELWKQ